MDLKFRKTGNEIAVLAIFVFVCCVVGAGLGWISDRHLNLRPVGLGCWFLIMGLYAQHLRNRKRTQTPETALPQPGK
jgi:F0F1-type ATP synthase assembly protein I